MDSGVATVLVVVASLGRFSRVKGGTRCLGLKVEEGRLDGGDHRDVECRSRAVTPHWDVDVSWTGLGASDKAAHLHDGTVAP